MSEDRALTIRQPYASLIMAGVKDVENRSWPVPSTLPLWHTCARCAGRWEPDGGRYDPNASRLHLAAPGTLSCGDAYDEPCKVYPDGPFPFRLWIHAAATWADGWTRRPLASGKLGYTLHHPVYGDQGWIGSDQLGVLLGSVLVTSCHHADECEQERGDTAAYFYCSPWAQGGDNVYHWTLTDPQPLAEPIPMKGRQGLWRVPHSSGGFLVGSSSPSTPSTSTD